MSRNKFLKKIIKYAKRTGTFNPHFYVKDILEYLKMEWLDIKDQLPDAVFDWVLVFADGAMCTMAYSSKNGFYEVYGNTCGNIVVEEITHWQHLPEEPKVT